MDRRAARSARRGCALQWRLGADERQSQPGARDAPAGSVSCFTGSDRRGSGLYGARVAGALESAKRRCRWRPPRTGRSPGARAGIQACPRFETVILISIVNIAAHPKSRLFFAASLLALGAAGLSAQVSLATVVDLAQRNS